MHDAAVLNFNSRPQMLPNTQGTSIWLKIKSEQYNQAGCAAKLWHAVLAMTKCKMLRVKVVKVHNHYIADSNLDKDYRGFLFLICASILSPFKTERLEKDE